MRGMEGIITNAEEYGSGERTKMAGRTSIVLVPAEERFGRRAAWGYGGLAPSKIRIDPMPSVLSLVRITRITEV